MRRQFCAVFLVLMVSLAAMGQRRGAAAMGGPIPAGTQLSVRMIDSLSSATAKAGDTFRASLEQAVVVNGRTMYPRGADVTGQVTRAHPSGRLSDPGELELIVTAIAGYPVNVEPLRMKGESHAKSNVGKIGGGAAAGAIIGAIAGGGKGAAIGAGVGAAGGTAVAAATGKKDTKIESEAVLNWMTAPPPAYTQGTQAAQRYRDYRDRNYDRAARSYDNDRDEDRDRRYDSRDQRGGYEGNYDVFGQRDRRDIRMCLSGSNSGLPPGLAKKDRLPPGLERQVQRNGTLPPGLQKRVQPLPGVCSARLPRLPVDWVRVILGRRVLILDPAQRITDLFNLDDND